MLRAATLFAIAGTAAASVSCDIQVDDTPNGRWDGGSEPYAALYRCGPDGAGGSNTGTLDDCNFEACDSSIYSAGLFLGQNGVAPGTIPASIGSLSNIENLHLWMNGLTGTIPDSIGSLTNTKGMFLDQNSLTGTIPSSIGNLNQVTWLALHGNSLTGTIPAEITQCTSLEQLYLDNNLLTGSIPDDIGNLSNLQRFAIWGSTSAGLAGDGGSENDLQGSLPRSFGSLTDLEFFTISNNDKMSGYPLRKEHCDLIANRQIACSLTDITFTACDSECADYMQTPHGELEFPSTDGGCGATCEEICDYGDWEWQCTNPDVASCYNTYNPCKNLHCEKVEEVNAATYTADRDYELVVLKSGTNFPIENVNSGDVLSHFSGNTISHVIKCIEVECFESQCIDTA